MANSWTRTGDTIQVNYGGVVLRVRVRSNSQPKRGWISRLITYIFG